LNKIPFVDLKTQYISIKKEIDSAIETVLSTSNFIGGEQLEKLSERLCTQLSVKNVLTVANGTDALFISLKQLGVGRGDEVITTAHSWISTSETISQTGAKPIFIDTNKFYCLDESLIEKKINSKTKAIIPVHLYGHPCDMTTINRIAKKYNLAVIEDCAQAILTKWLEKNVGTFGDAGTLSFFPGKNLGAYGDAGAIMTNSDSLHKKAKMYANHGSLIKHEHKVEGINSRMDSLQAAILNVKIQYLKEWIDKRRLVAKMYSHYLRDVEEIALPLVDERAFHTYHLFVIKSLKRKSLKVFLEDKHISTGIHYPKALPMLDCYKYLNLDLDEFPNACNNSKTVLSLPMFPELKENQIKYISKSIKEFYKT